MFVNIKENALLSSVKNRCLLTANISEKPWKFREITACHFNYWAFVVYQKPIYMCKEHICKWENSPTYQLSPKYLSNAHDPFGPGIFFDGIEDTCLFEYCIVQLHFFVVDCKHKPNIITENISCWVWSAGVVNTWMHVYLFPFSR